MTPTAPAKESKANSKGQLPRRNRAVISPSSPSASGSGKIAAIILRSFIDVPVDVRKTLFMLHLRKKHTCVVYPDKPTIRGMFQKAKDQLTWGTISEETFQLLVSRRKKKQAEDGTPYFHLSPPRGGFERRGIKNAFADKGALGYRGDKMNDLIKKMI